MIKKTKKLGRKHSSVFSYLSKKSKKARSAIGRMTLMNYAQIETTDGLVLFVDGDVEEGADVWVIDDNGDYVAAQNGEWVVDGQTIVVTDGKIESIDEAGVNAESEELEEVEVEADGPTMDDLEEIAAATNDVIDVVKTIDEKVDDIEDKVEKVEAEMRRHFASSNGRVVNQSATRRAVSNNSRMNQLDSKMAKLSRNFKR